jgi:5-methylcytosine-specific restriction endonuclease McrA
VKQCSMCGETKPPDQFSKYYRTKDGLQSRCKPCQKSSYEAYRTECGTRNIPPTKTCSVCGITKSSDEFHKSTGRPDGLHPKCKMCRNPQEKNWRDVHPKNVQTRNRKWRSAHVDQARAATRKHYAKNRPSMLLRAKAYALAHPDKQQASTQRRMANGYFRKWRLANPGKVRDYARRYRALKRNSPGEFTEEQFRRLCAFYGNVCVKCGLGGVLEPDHVVPISKGGSNDIGNIQPLCRNCNRTKSDKTADYRPTAYKQEKLL